MRNNKPAIDKPETGCAYLLRLGATLPDAPPHESRGKKEGEGMKETDYAELLKRFPDAQRATMRQEIAPSTYDLQDAKHKAHGQCGGAVALLVTDKEEILLAHRGGDLHPGWSLPGGTVEPGETFEEAIKREILEEAGLSLQDPRLVLLEEKIFTAPERPELTFMLAVFKARIDPQDIPPPTKAAREEKLDLALFPRRALPPEMIMHDREKIERFCG